MNFGAHYYCIRQHNYPPYIGGRFREVCRGCNPLYSSRKFHKEKVIFAILEAEIQFWNQMKEKISVTWKAANPPPPFSPVYKIS